MERVSFISGYIWGIATAMGLFAAWFMLTLYLEERREKKRLRAREWKMRQRRGW